MAIPKFEEKQHVSLYRGRKKHKFCNRRGTRQRARIFAKSHTVSVTWWDWGREAIGRVRRIVCLCKEQGIMLNRLFSLCWSSIYAVVSTSHLLEEYCLKLEWFFSPESPSNLWCRTAQEYPLAIPGNLACFPRCNSDVPFYGLIRHLQIRFEV